MAKEKLEIIITAKDRASKVLGKIGGGLSTLSTVGAGAVGALGGGALLAGAKLVSMGSDAEEMMGKFNTVFGDYGPTMVQTFDMMADRLGRNQYELREFGAAFQDTFVPLGFARGEAANMSERLTELTVDLASFNNAAEPDVMNDLQSAIVGNHETMRKYGVIITQATLDQQLLSDGIAGGVKEASEQEKAMARMALIFDGTSDAQGDAARTSEEWANQMRELRGQITEAGQTMGLDLLPVVTPFLQDAREMAGELIPLLTEKFGDFADELSERGGPAVEKIKDSVWRIAEALGASTEGMSDAEIAAAGFGGALGGIVDVIESVADGMERIAAVAEASENFWDFLTAPEFDPGVDPLSRLAFGEGGAQEFFQGVREQNAPPGGGGFDNTGMQAIIDRLINDRPPITVMMDGEKVAELVSRRQKQKLDATMAVGGHVGL